MALSHQQTHSDGLIGPEQLISVHGCSTVASLFRYQCQQKAAVVAHREKTRGIWRSKSWSDYYHDACLIGAGLAACGMKPRDRVAILSKDNRYWLCSDMGITVAGGIPTGVYTTDSAEQLAYIVNDSGASFLFVENDEQLDKFRQRESQMPSLLKVIVFEKDGLRDLNHAGVIFIDDLIKLGETFLQANTGYIDAQIDSLCAEDTALLIYTSGTTGQPKGAMLTHRNVIFQLSICQQLLDIRDTDEQLCFLPLCHIYERVLSAHLPLMTGTTVNFTESVDTVFDNMREVSPHTFSAVPRFWEKVYSRVRIHRAEATAVGRWALDAAVSAGLALHQQPGAWINRCRYAFWNFLVLRNLRRLLGMDRMRRGGSGAAPVSVELLHWFNAIGVPLYEGYGATETTAVISVNTPDANRFGSVGRPLPGTEVRIADNAEILVRGPHVFKGYWNQPEATGAVFDSDGWFQTGDTGSMSDGYLSIDGRIKDIIITAGGKNISPSDIESRLKFSAYISDAVVLGDRRKYLTCLIMIDQENVEQFAQSQRVPFSDFASLCAAEAVVDLIQSEVENVNKTVSRVEQIKKFRLIDVLLQAEDDELTPTMKLKRDLVGKRHAALIESMYHDSDR